MSTFKKGDKVEITVDYMHAKAGDILTVIDSSSFGSVWCKHDESGRDMGGQAWRFKLAQPKYDHNGLKVGDKVRYTPSLWKGMEGTVHAFHEGYVELLVTKLPDNHSGYSEVVVGKTLNETVGGLGVSPFSFEKIEQSFKVGDKVKFVGTVTGFAGRTVTVINTSNSSTYPLRVKRTDGQECPVKESELQHITEQEAEEVKPFTYKDIQKGDKIRRTRTYKSGSVEVREGAATDPAFGGYWGDGQFILAYDSDDNNKDVTLELLERPEPPKSTKPVKVEPWDTIGTAGVLYRKNSYAEELDTFVKKADGSWVIFYPDGGTYNIGKEEQIKEYFRDSECIAPAVK